MTQPLEDADLNPTEWPTGPRPRRSKSTAVVMAAFLGLVAGIVAVAITMSRSGDSIPRMTEADFNAAVTRWEKNGPANYDLDVLVGGRRAGKVHVEVRDGEVTNMTRDGVEPSQRR